MIRRFFLAHPRSVGESYWRHARVAIAFGCTMIASGLACLVHAALPELFQRTASDAVRKLYGRMKVREPGCAAGRLAEAEPVWQLEYEI